MHKRIAAICLVFTLLMTFIPAGPAYTAAAPLSTPKEVSISTEGTCFIIKWQNPSDISELAKSVYKNYNGMVDYIIDWRVNNGAWHYDREIPGDQEIFTFYPNISWQFWGRLCDYYGEIAEPKVKISKVFVGVSYNTTIEEWLRKNNVEFRIRYIYSYWSESSEQMENQQSVFSDIALLGAANPTGGMEPGPRIGEYSMPDPPSSIEAVQSLESEYMTLNLRWREPEIIRTLVELERFSPYVVIDWKLNNSEWNDGLRGPEDINYTMFMEDAGNTFPDKYGYVSVEISRRALNIPYGMKLSTWLADKTCYFRIRYVLRIPEDNGYREIISPYSNTVNLGRGVTAPQKSKQ